MPVNPSEFIRLNVVLQPPIEVVQYAISLSKEIAEQYKTVFILDGVNFYPHITLYFPEYPAENISKALKIIEQIASQTPKILMTSIGLETYSTYSGSIMLNFDKTQEIVNLHRKVVASLNGLRNGHVREKWRLGVDYSPIQLENIKLYGDRNIMDLFKPHLTISALLENPEEAGKLASKLKWDINKFIVGSMAVYEMGVHGTCRKLVKEFPLL